MSLVCRRRVSFCPGSETEKPQVFINNYQDPTRCPTESFWVLLKVTKVGNGSRTDETRVGSGPYLLMVHECLIGPGVGLLAGGPTVTWGRGPTKATWCLLRGDPRGTSGRLVECVSPGVPRLGPGVLGVRGWWCREGVSSTRGTAVPAATKPTLVYSIPHGHGVFVQTTGGQKYLVPPRIRK